MAEATSVEQVKDVRDKAEALRAYAKQADMTLDMQNRCAELKLRSERKAGELLAEMPKNPGGRGKTSDPLSGVCSHHQSSRWQRIARIPDPQQRAAEEVANALAT